MSLRGAVQLSDSLTPEQTASWDRAKAIRDVRGVTLPIIAIIAIRHRCPMPRDALYQVTIDPAELDESKEFIRFGDSAGDEYTGWLAVDDVELRKVLAAYGEGESVPKVRSWRGVTLEHSDVAATLPSVVKESEGAGRGL